VPKNLPSSPCACYASPMPANERQNERPSRFALDLLHRATQLVDEQFARCVGNFDFTPRQYVVLAAIAQSEGLSQTAIVNATGVDRSTVAEMVARLMKNGWLQRRRTKEDTRAYAVNLTDEGRKALKVGERAAREVEETVLAALPVARRDQFMQALAKIAKAGSVLQSR